MKFKYLVGLLFITSSIFVQANESAKQTKLKELVNVMDMGSMVESIYSQMEVAMQDMSTKMGVQPNEQAIFDEYYSQMILIMKENLSWAKMEPLAVDIYDRNFTEDEITDMLVFYKTETGKSLLKKMPAVMQESMQMSQTLIEGSIPKLQQIESNLRADLEKARKAE
ncbi:DUF2059 domain-containing protein [Teredinibacter franksiae]|uniref:DUF2059 domain-containing protein n=1 Tax=Teredinibacter franksiae TaxID=2761453 RepID=UPI0016282235|nr:DUF2059 domain-containing protein [Teredinibacter franksiae]